MSEMPRSNPWFGISMALIGLIVGYGIAMVAGITPGGGGAVVPQPSQPIVADDQEPEVIANADNVRPVDPTRDHIRGNPNAPISIIEYSDFECPFCKRVHPTIQAVLDKYGDDVNWVYRHYPLSFHPNAQITAEASECAAELGGNDSFWEFSDLVFERGAIREQLKDYAVEVGLDGDDFQTCLDSGKFTELVNTELAEGSKAGVSGTPGNIVLHNEKKLVEYVSGAQPQPVFESAVDKLLES